MLWGDDPGGAIPVLGSDRRRFYALLHQGLVASPATAARATVVTEHQRGVIANGAR